MLPRKRGSIVNTASVAGHAGFIGYPAYTASKHAATGLTKVAALEYAQPGDTRQRCLPGNNRYAAVSTLFKKNFRGRLCSHRAGGQIGSITRGRRSYAMAVLG